MQITQQSLPLKVVHRCRECGRPIKEEGFGGACKRKLVAKVISKALLSVDKKYWPLIKEFLENEGV